jgi:nickel transport protein
VKRAALVLALGLLSGLAQAHEVLSSVERGRAIAVKAYFADGEVLAYSEYQVFSPADAKIPYQKGRTDRAGYLAFVPDTPGRWHVRMVDATGHGLELDVAAEAPGQAPARPAAASAGPATWAFVLRPLVGAVLIAAIFAVLIVLYRRKGPKR